MDAWAVVLGLIGLSFFVLAVGLYSGIGKRKN